MIKDAFVGAGGVGKTEIMKCLDREHGGEIGIELVQEAARDYFTDHPEFRTDQEKFAYEPQSAIQMMALEREWAASRKKPKYTGCDRSVLDAPIFVTAIGDEARGLESLHRVKFWLPTYTNIYLLDPADVPHKTDEVRRESATMRQHLHETFLDFFASQGIAYQLLSGTVEERMAVVRAGMQRHMPS